MRSGAESHQDHTILEQTPTKSRKHSAQGLTPVAFLGAHALLVQRLKVLPHLGPAARGRAVRCTGLVRVLAQVRQSSSYEPLHPPDLASRNTRPSRTFATNRDFPLGGEICELL